MAPEVQIRGAGSTAKVRDVVGVPVLTFVTLGIYGIVWYYKVNRELADYGRANGHGDELGDSGDVAGGGHDRRADRRAGAGVDLPKLPARAGAVGLHAERAELVLAGAAAGGRLRASPFRPDGAGPERERGSPRRGARPGASTPR